MGERAGHTVDIVPGYGWTETRRGGLVFHGVGRRESVAQIIQAIREHDPPDPSRLVAKLANIPGHFAVIANGPSWVLALTDRVAGFPVFYGSTALGLHVSNAARKIAERSQLSECDPDLLTEFRMAGYVTGSNTLVKGVDRLRAGEMLFFDDTKGSLERSRYYQFYSPNVRSETRDQLVEELDCATDTIFRRLIQDAGGRQIIVPLSGGLDSRLVLCKLAALGYDNLVTFSYGMPSNWEALTAKRVAQKVGVPWIFVPTGMREAYRAFWSDQRRAYWQYADHLHVVPNMHTFYALTALARNPRIADDAIFVNGQSGDFIAGNHIPSIRPEEATYDRLVVEVIGKHYSLRRDLLQDERSRTIASKRIASILGGPPKIRSYQEFAKQFELWEWQARQTARVVHGQRNYDFFEHEWELPLWDLEYLHFWEEVPLKERLGRTLFREWLRRRNYFGLFRDLDYVHSAWPRGRGWMLTVGRALTLVFGRKISERYYNIARYLGNYGYLYAQNGMTGYLSRSGTFRTPIPFFAEIWERENIATGQNGPRLRVEWAPERRAKRRAAASRIR